MRLDKSPPVFAQIGLKDTLQKQNYFLAGLGHPEQNMTVALPNQQHAFGEFTFAGIHPEMMSQTKRMAYLKGAPMNDIYADAFHVFQEKTQASL